MTDPGTDSDRKLIAAIIERQASAWRQGDARTFAEGFMADGCFVNVLDMLTYGREPFEAQHARIFASIYDGSTISLPIRRSHFIRNDVAIVNIDAELNNPRGFPPGLVAAADGVMRTRLQEIFVKEKDQWMIASFHNVDIKPAP